MLVGRTRPVGVKQLLGGMLVILVRERRDVHSHCLASLQEERLREPLETFQFHPSCVRKIVNTVSCVVALYCESQMN